MYSCVERMEELCSRLQDDLSRKVFWARLMFDVEPSMENAIGLASMFKQYSFEQMNRMGEWKEAIQSAQRTGKKLYLYGTNFTGQAIARILTHEGMEFEGYCSRGAAKFTDGLAGKPVVKPEWLFAHAQECAVIIAADESYGEIAAVLQQNAFPREQIIPTFLAFPATKSTIPPYFAFPEFYPHNTTFIDGGCFDGADSIRFIERFRGAYASVYAFEPDPDNFLRCEARLKQPELHAVKVIQAGLSGESGKADFLAKGNMTSRITEFETIDASQNGQLTTIQTCMLDDVVQEDRLTVGMIKLDVEGAECAVLKGAEKTIQRDTPLLAIAVDHRCGDVLAIMDYCAKLCPSYKFWIRQHGCINDTVLYASAHDF